MCIFERGLYLPLGVKKRGGQGEWFQEGFSLTPPRPSPVYLCGVRWYVMLQRRLDEASSSKLAEVSREFRPRSAEEPTRNNGSTPPPSVCLHCSSTNPFRDTGGSASDHNYPRMQISHGYQRAPIARGATDARGLLLRGRSEAFLEPRKGNERGARKNSRRDGVKSSCACCGNDVAGELRVSLLVLCDAHGTMTWQRPLA